MLSKIKRPLICLFLLCTGWTAWQWWRPYEMGSAAPWQVEQVTVRRDHGFAWVDIEISPRSGDIISAPPVGHFANDNGVTHQAADARISRDGKTCQIRYWMNLAELELPTRWKLIMDDASLIIKQPGFFSLDDGESRVFRQSHW
jgi:hypothetical protein